jgi:hypothetical protein
MLELLRLNLGIAKCFYAKRLHPVKKKFEQFEQRRAPGGAL